jgi:hypothetical protein
MNIISKIVSIEILHDALLAWSSGIGSACGAIGREIESHQVKGWKP